MKHEHKRFKSNSLGSINLKIPTDYINISKQKAGLMPNVIHALDATNIVNLIELLNKDLTLNGARPPKDTAPAKPARRPGRPRKNSVEVVKPAASLPVCLLTIHDCFGTHASNVGAIQHRVKEAFILIYTHKDFIAKFHKQCEDILHANSGTTYDYAQGIITMQNGKTMKLPKIPEQGELVHGAILQSRHMVGF